jgi:hypothetical protein
VDCKICGTKMYDPATGHALAALPPTYITTYHCPNGHKYVTTYSEAVPEYGIEGVDTHQWFDEHGIEVDTE